MKAKVFFKGLPVGMIAPEDLETRVRESMAASHDEMLLRALNEDVLDRYAGVAVPQMVDVSESHDAASMLSVLEQWRKYIIEDQPKAFEPVKVPRYLRSVFKQQGMSDDQIDRIYITNITPGSVIPQPNGNPQVVTIEWQHGL